MTASTIRGVCVCVCVCVCVHAGWSGCAGHAGACALYLCSLFLVSWHRYSRPNRADLHTDPPGATKGFIQLLSSNSHIYICNTLGILTLNSSGGGGGTGGSSFGGGGGSKPFDGSDGGGGGTAFSEGDGGTGPSPSFWFFLALSCFNFCRFWRCCLYQSCCWSWVKQP